MRGVTQGYALAYRLGLTPWERYGHTAATALGALLDREEADRPRPPGRALDLGCGRGQKTRLLAARGWEAVGVDVVPRAVAAARRGSAADMTFRVADVTALEAAHLGSFDLFLDVGCFQHLDARARAATARGVTALARPGAALLMLEFQDTPVGRVAGGVSRAQVEEAFRGWRTLSVEAAATDRLGWPLTTTRPQWYHLRLGG